MLILSWFATMILTGSWTIYLNPSVLKTSLLLMSVYFVLFSEASLYRR